jgi:hypothetical protein
MEGVGVEGLLSNISKVTKYQIRMEGVQRLLTVFFIWLLIRLIINPLLLDNPEMLLTMKWYTPTILRFITGVKGYTVMKTNDMLLSLTHIIWGVRTIQYFYLPFLVTRYINARLHLFLCLSLMLIGSHSSGYLGPKYLWGWVPRNKKKKTFSNELNFYIYQVPMEHGCKKCIA